MCCRWRGDDGRGMSRTISTWTSRRTIYPASRPTSTVARKGPTWDALHVLMPYPANKLGLCEYAPGMCGNGKRRRRGLGPGEPGRARWYEVSAAVGRRRTVAGSLRTATTSSGFRLARVSVRERKTSKRERMPAEPERRPAGGVGTIRYQHLFRPVCPDRNPAMLALLLGPARRAFWPDGPPSARTRSPRCPRRPEGLSRRCPRTIVSRRQGLASTPEG